MTDETKSLILAMAHYAVSQPRLKKVYETQALFDRAILETGEQRRVFDTAVNQAIQVNMTY